MSKAIDEAELGISLRPRARIMHTLGDELISNDSVAIIELVKNSYDADATLVHIKFSGPLEVGKGRLEVTDNGHGMSWRTVKECWMEPATSNKKTNKTTGAKRRVLGEKGIGRFATIRISSELELITRAVDADVEVYGYFDWSQLDEDGKYLDQVLFLTEERSPQEFCVGGGVEALYNDEDLAADLKYHGTMLRMNLLKQVWTEKKFSELQRGLSRLMPPFGQVQDFKIVLDATSEFSHFSSEISPPEVLKHPHYSVLGSVRRDGGCTLSISSVVGGENRSFDGGFVRNKSGELQLLGKKIFDESKGGNAALSCGPFEFDIRVWNRDDLGNLIQATSSTLRDVRADLDSIAGINIYRDGFRVLPYGEPNNDWLRLDIRRVQKPTLHLSNNQISGYISISADSNPNLVDQSNRQGLDENQAAHDLRDAMLSVLAEVEDFRDGLRPKKTREKSGEQGGIFSPPSLQDLRSHLETITKKDEKTNALIRDAEDRINEKFEEIKQSISRYQRLATLGQLSDMLLHDGRNPLSAILTDSVLGRERVEKIGVHANKDNEYLHKKFGSIEKQGDVLGTLFRRIEPFSGRKRGRPKQLVLENIIRDSFAVLDSTVSDLGVTVSLPASETIVRLDESEMQEVFVNLLSNSLYWLQFTSPEERRIIVDVYKKTDDLLEVLFSDSGPGIPEEYRDRIFDPYFSKRKGGVGLGLSMVGEIVSGFYGGSFDLLESGPLPGATFLISLRKRI